MNRRMEWLNLDKEWIQLMMEAKESGMELSTIRDFLNGNEVKEILIKK